MLKGRRKAVRKKTLASFYKLIALEVMTTSNLEILLGEEGHANHIELLYHGSTNTRRLDAPPFEPPSKIISMSRKRWTSPFAWGLSCTVFLDCTPFYGRAKTPYTLGFYPLHLKFQGYFLNKNSAHRRHISGLLQEVLPKFEFFSIPLHCCGVADRQRTHR